MILPALTIFLLLFVSALFSASETALTSCSRPLMHSLEKDGNRRAATVNRLLERRELLIGTVLLGNNTVNILASSLATSVLIAWFGESGVVYATAAMTILVLVFGEVLPKTVALTYPTACSLAVAPLIRLLVWVFAPITKVLQGCVALTMRLFQREGAVGPTSETVLAELRGVIDYHTQSLGGDMADIAHERAMLRSVLDLNEVEVCEIMVHRRNLVTVNADLPVREIVEQVLASPYTRLPLWREKDDNIIGVLHVKDLLRAVQDHSDKGDLAQLDVASVAAAPWFIPDVTCLHDQLQAFRQRREHFALVVDEYGTLQGVVTLEDILEEIVGEISDEHDVEPVAGVRQQPDGSYIINGEVTLRDLNRRFDWELPDDSAATLAGLLLHESRTIPDVGQTFAFYGFRFEVLRRQRNRIALIRLSSDAPPSVDDAG